MKTALSHLHDEAGARIVEFAGWDMPLHYGSQLQEHHAVRERAGCFDVSHMAVVDVPESSELLLCRLLVGDIRTLNAGQAIYTLMLNDHGGIVDDLIAYRRLNGFRLVINAGTTQKDLAWIRDRETELGVAAHITHRDDMCIVAVQGPHAVAKVSAILDFENLAELPSFSFAELGSYFIARTGYTGEDGVEIICPAQVACELWTALVENGVAPCGLGARDSLRLEAGLNLYGHDMSEDTHPLECRVAWTIDWRDVRRRFIGRNAIEKIHVEGSARKLVGMRLTERGVPREGCIVRTDAGAGVVTSGSFSPTLQCGIALARVPQASRGRARIEVRKRAIAAKTARLPFVRREIQN